MDETIKDLKTQIQSILDEKLISNDQNNISYLNRKQELLYEKLQSVLYEKISTLSISDTEEDRVQTEKIYIDPVEFPGFLFLHDSIVKAYGICPHLKIEDSYNSIKEKRHYWLKQKNDKGKLYYELYDKIINEKDIKISMKKKSNLEDEIHVIINSILDVKHKEMYNDALLMLDEYASARLKTKKIKEKYKKIVYIFSEIYKECHIGIHEYVSEKAHVDILINTDDSFNDENEQIRFLKEHFKDYIEKYKKLNSELNQHSKYCKNTKKHLLLAWETCSNDKNEIFIQTGKYFKKWSCLKQEEQIERLESFTKYYISKKIYINENHGEQQDKILFKQEHEENLFSFLKNAIINNELKYTYMKWNIKTGVIDNISALNIEMSPEQNLVFSFQTKTNTKQKTSTIKTIMTKENEQKINEYILTFILKNKGDNKVKSAETKQDTKDDPSIMDICFEQIKLKLNYKKLSKSDKIILTQKYNDIYAIIEKNKKRILNN